MGIKPAEFWCLTFAEMRLIAEGYNERERNKNYRAAMIVAAIYNVNRDPKKRKKAYTPEEILGEKKQKPEEMMEMAKDLTVIHDGEVSGVI